MGRVVHLPPPRRRRRWRPRGARRRPLLDIVLWLLLAGAIAWLVWRLAAIEGVAVAIDGDSLRLAGREIRLFGIDAPELHQNCRDENGRPWPCGRAARRELRRILRRGKLTCHGVDTDRYGREIALCRIGDEDVAELLVRRGLAVALGAASPYAAAERAARAARRGIWRGEFETPATWRRRHRR